MKSVSLLISTRISAPFERARSFLSSRFPMRDGLEAWCKLATRLGIPEFKTVAKTPRRHREGILNSHEHGKTNSLVEGLNHTIKLLKKTPYACPRSSACADTAYSLWAAANSRALRAPTICFSFKSTRMSSHHELIDFIPLAHISLRLRSTISRYGKSGEKVAFSCHFPLFSIAGSSFQEPYVVSRISA